MEKLMEINLI